MSAKLKPVRMSILLSILLWTLPPAARAASAGQPAVELDYPPAQRSAQVDDYHGVAVADPYRWLEDLAAPATHAWMASQEKLFEGFIDGQRASQLERRIERLGKTGARISAPIHAGGRYFYGVNEPQLNNSVIYMRQGLEGAPTEVLDPNALFTGDERLGGFSVSPQGTYLAYRTTVVGSSWGDLTVRHVASGKELPIALGGLAGASLVWRRDERGFFVVRYGQTASLVAGSSEPRAEIVYQPVGGDAAPQIVYHRPDQPSWLFNPSLSNDDRFLVVTVFAGTSSHNKVLY
ncbi:MAG: hypothetical protein AAF657_15485, partial [Acidobacteriota bacterium]